MEKSWSPSIWSLDSCHGAMTCGYSSGRVSVLHFNSLPSVAGTRKQHKGDAFAGHCPDLTTLRCFSLHHVNNSPQNYVLLRHGSPQPSAPFNKHSADVWQRWKHPAGNKQVEWISLSSWKFSYFSMSNTELFWGEWGSGGNQSWTSFCAWVK